MHVPLHIGLIGLASIGAEAAVLRRDTPLAKRQAPNGSGMGMMNDVMEHLDQNGHVSWSTAGSDELTAVPADLFNAAASNLTRLHARDAPKDDGDWQNCIVEPSQAIWGGTPLPKNLCPSYGQGNPAGSPGAPSQPGAGVEALGRWVTNGETFGEWGVRVWCNEDNNATTVAKSVMAKHATSYCRTLVASNQYTQLAAWAWQMLKEGQIAFAALIAGDKNVPDVYEEACTDAFRMISLGGVCDAHGDQKGFTGQTHGAYVQIGGDPNDYKDPKKLQAPFEKEGTITYAFDPAGKLDYQKIKEQDLDTHGPEASAR